MFFDVEILKSPEVSEGYEQYELEYYVLDIRSNPNPGEVSKFNIDNSLNEGAYSSPVICLF